MNELKHEFKAGQRCDTCGDTDEEVLTFAHWKRAEKLKSKKNNRTVPINQIRGLQTLANEAKKTRFLCHFCHRIETSLENRELFDGKCAAARASIRRNRQYATQAKLDAKWCVDCHRSVSEDTCCGFDFDHIDEKSKVACVSVMVASCAPITRIEQEIAKCQLRCANCHQKRTNRRRDAKTISLAIIQQLISTVVCGI